MRKADLVHLASEAFVDPHTGFDLCFDLRVQAADEVFLRYSNARAFDRFVEILYVIIDGRISRCRIEVVEAGDDCERLRSFADGL